MSKLLVRMARKVDAECIAHLLSKSQWFTYSGLYSERYIEALVTKYYSVERIEQETTSTDKGWHGYMVAEMDGEIVGTIGAGMRNETEGEIYVFYMDPEMRGKGIGSRLLDFCTKIQKHRYNASTQWVSVAKGNMYGIPFYEAKGFLFEREEIAYGSVLEDDDISLVYSRRL